MALLCCSQQHIERYETLAKGREVRIPWVTTEQVEAQRGEDDENEKQNA